MGQHSTGNKGHTRKVSLPFTRDFMNVAFNIGDVSGQRL